MIGRAGVKLGASIVFVAMATTGCAAKIGYIPPPAPPSAAGTQTVKLAFDQAWSRLIANSGRTFFVINNIDKSSGFMNLSYTGDPQEFLDCGILNVQSQNIEGNMDGRYPLARERQVIHFHTGLNVDMYLQHEITVEGRANIVVQRETEQDTRMEATVRYIVRRNARYLSGFSPLPPGISETASFNSGQTGNFSSALDGKQISCVSTGAFERALLSLLN
ncbi:MAG: hypothetical protein HY985_01840 [Magnetospirillum sp.]|nr:hypothetical protein [Magnetospirillum sp.]